MHFSVVVVLVAYACTQINATCTPSCPDAIELHLAKVQQDLLRDCIGVGMQTEYSPKALGLPFFELSPGLLLEVCNQVTGTEKQSACNISLEEIKFMSYFP